MCKLILFLVACDLLSGDVFADPVPGGLATPVIIRTGVLSSGAQFEDAANSALSQKKGIVDYNADEGFAKLFQKKLLDAALNSRYGEQKNVLNNHLDANHFTQGASINNNGAEGANIENKLLTKKGHHKNGFHNSYHKDEIGSNSSFYDDGESEGGQQVFKNNQGTYANAQAGNQRGDHTDMSLYNNQQGNQGHYIKGDNYDNVINNQQNHNQNQYYNDRRDADQRNSGRRYGDEANFNKESYMNKPHYSQPHMPVPVPIPPHVEAPRRRITIFEDPRYEVPFNQYHDDYIELDVRPARRGDYMRQPPRDYY